MFTKIDHIAIYVTNLEVSTNLYITNFGFTKYKSIVIPDGTHVNYMKLGELYLELIGKQVEHADNFHFCILSDSFDDDVMKLIECGMEQKTDIHNAIPRTVAENTWRRVVFCGPDKEEIEIRG